VIRQPTVIRGGHVSSLHALSSELGSLHREMLRAGHDEVRPVRMAVLTLVAVCTDEETADRAAGVVQRLATNHPSRAILVVADRNAMPDGFDADLALECSTVGGADQICAESVRLVVRGAPALHLASAITPLLVPDVPVVLWLVDAPPLEQALHAEVLTVCERIILDSDAYPEPLDTLHALARAHREHGHLPIGDLAWARLLPWRELLAQSFDGREMTPYLGGVQRVEFVSCGERPSSEAWLLAGWMASRLQWRQDGGPDIVMETRDDESVDVGGVLEVHLHCRLDGRTAEVSVCRDGDTVVTRISTGEGLAAHGTSRARVAELHDLVGRELQESGEDRIYTEALRRGNALAEARARGRQQR
jgi:glucose-6-phosphate dehydrogenase assembly protein OpcA